MPDIDPFAPEFRRKKDRREWFLSRRFRTNWVEDSYNPEVSGSMADFISRGTSHVGSSLKKNNRHWFVCFLLGLFLVLGFRLAYLQLWRGDMYRELAINNSERLIPIPAERGLLLDRNGQSLVENVPSFSLYLLPADLPRATYDREKIIARAAALSGQEVDYIKKKITDYQAYNQDSIIIKENIDYESALKLQVESIDAPSIFIAEGSKRLYDERVAASSTAPLPLSLSLILGYIGNIDAEELKQKRTGGYIATDLIGKTGLEKQYETELRGAPGRRRMQVNARGKAQTVLAEIPPQAGNHIQLALDLNYQRELEKIMQKYFDRAGKKRGVGIVTNPNTGEILALVNLPSFDNNDFSGGISTTTYKKYLDNENRPLFNRAISGLYPSGSTIKPVVAAAALEEKIINRTTTFLSNGGLRVGQWFFPDWKLGGHGITSVTKSLAWSVNTFFYNIGGGYGDFNGLGVERLTGYMRRFGFGSILGIDAPAEAEGFVPSKAWKQTKKNEPWYIGDTYNLSIGQGDLLVTPLQIAVMTGAFANGGTLYRPRLGTTIIDPVTKERQSLKPVVIRPTLASSETIEIVRDGMRECVSYGSCRLLSNLSFAVAGKTGTAQWNSKKENHAWFTSFAPFAKPEITVTILVEEGGEGSSISVPIANEFYQWWGRRR